MYDGAEKNYHVCVILKRLTRAIFSCATGGGEVWILDKNIDIFKSIGILLSKILLMNQNMTVFIRKKVDFDKGIDHHIKNKYDLDEIWLKSEEILNKPIDDCNKLSSYYRKIYELLLKLNLDDSSQMVGHALNGLYLGLIMEMEIEELYKEPDIFDIIYVDGIKRVANGDFNRSDFFKIMYETNLERLKMTKTDILREVTELEGIENGLS